MSDTVSAREYAWEDDRVIPSDACIGLEWSHGSATYRTEGEFLADGTRKAILKISSWTEIGSFGASHWYASIEAHVEVNDDDGCSHGGYLPGAPNPRVGDSIKIEVQRKLQKMEKDVLGRPIGKRGEMTGRFNSEDDARAAAIKTFRRRFGAGWSLIEHELYDDKRNILATT